MGNFFVTKFWWEDTTQLTGHITCDRSSLSSMASAVLAPNVEDENAGDEHQGHDQHGDGATERNWKDFIYELYFNHILSPVESSV